MLHCERYCRFDYHWDSSPALMYSWYYASPTDIHKLLTISDPVWTRLLGYIMQSFSLVRRDAPFAQTNCPYNAPEQMQYTAKHCLLQFFVLSLLRCSSPDIACTHALEMVVLCTESSLLPRTREASIAASLLRLRTVERLRVEKLGGADAGSYQGRRG